MASFSERNGYVVAPQNMSPGTVTPSLRNKLWNVIDRCIKWDDIDKISFVLWHQLYKEPLDTRGEYESGYGTNWKPTWQNVRERVMTGPWYTIYDHLELLIKNGFLAEGPVNYEFEMEKAAYRYIKDHIVQVTDESELREIEEAANATDAFAISGKHIRDSLALLADRQHPDYRNSIKESISAVESVAQVVVGSSSDSLGKALGKMRKNNMTEGALLEGFSKIYGWTSDKEGIRHALMDMPKLGHDEAKFFLVACSAFANYLKSMNER